MINLIKITLVLTNVFNVFLLQSIVLFKGKKSQGKTKYDRFILHSCDCLISPETHSTSFMYLYFIIPSKGMLGYPTTTFGNCQLNERIMTLAKAHVLHFNLF